MSENTVKSGIKRANVMGTEFPRILVCGGRNYYNQARVNEVLDAHKPSVIIHGAARGADTLASRYASTTGIPQIACPADWAKHGLKAGFLRNQQMLNDHKPDLVIAFPGGRGTADMVRRARRAKVPVIEIGEQ
jgi:hypothetical protein